MRFAVKNTIVAGNESLVDDPKDLVFYKGYQIPLEKIKEFIATSKKEPVMYDITQEFIRQINIAQRWNISIDAMASDHLGRFEKANLENPIIVLDQIDVIDGLHRVIKALSVNKTELPAYLLVEPELDTLLPVNVSDAEPAQEGFITTVVAVHLLAPLALLVVGLPIMTIITKLRDHREKKNPAFQAARVVKLHKDIAGDYHGWPLVSDKHKDGTPRWLLDKSEPHDKIVLLPPEDMKAYYSKVFNVVKAFADIHDSKGCLAIMDKVFISQFGKDNIKINVNGTISDTIRDVKAVPVTWPNSKWYHLRPIPSGTERTYSLNEMHKFMDTYTKNMLAAITKIGSNTEQILKAAPSQDKEEMADRLAYIRLAYGLINYADTTMQSFHDDDRQLAYETAVEDPEDPDSFYE